MSNWRCFSASSKYWNFSWFPAFDFVFVLPTNKRLYNSIICMIQFHFCRTEILNRLLWIWNPNNQSNEKETTCNDLLKRYFNVLETFINCSSSFHVNFLSFDDVLSSIKFDWNLYLYKNCSVFIAPWSSLLTILWKVNNGEIKYLEESQSEREHKNCWWDEGAQMISLYFPTLVFIKTEYKAGKEK